MVFKKGHRHSEETKKKIGASNKKSLKGNKWSDEQRKKFIKSHTGFRHSGISKEKMRNIAKGRKHLFQKKSKPWNYIDGRSKLFSPARYGDDWDKIRYLVYLRDKFSCQVCGIKGKRLDVHHKIPFLISFDNSLRNLMTLCRKCHMKEERKIHHEIKQRGILL